MKNKTILITGGAGFIGFHLAKRLIKDNEVLILDKKEPKLGTWIKGDITKKDWFDKVEVCNIIFHLAAVVGVDYVSLHPDETENTEIIGMQNIIKFAKQKNIEKIIYSSTSSVYESKDMPTAYNLAKLKAEELLKSSRLRYCILRLFNVYGINQKDYMVIPRFIKQAKNNENITVFGDGLQTRDFTYVDDVINVIIGLIEHEGIYDIGTGKKTTILELAKTIKKLIASNSEIITQKPGNNRMAYEVSKRCSNPEKLNSIGLACQTTLMDGIKLMLNNIY